MRRHEAREKVLQALFQVDLGGASTDQAVNDVLDEVENVSQADRAYIEKLVSGTRQACEQIDGLLSAHVQGWRLERIAKVDLNVLRLALYELLHEHDVDAATVVNEAVELAKSFGTGESGKFVNGVLARLLPVVRNEQK